MRPRKTAPLTVVDHPLVARALTRLRDKSTPLPEFRQLLLECGRALAWEATRDLETRRIRVQTPLAPANGQALRRPVTLVPVLRAGLALLDAFREVLPDASIGFIGQRRDEETLQPETYLFKVPEVKASDVFVLDPMLATGGSANSTLDLLRRHGARRLRLVCLLAAPEGIQAVQEAHPDVPIHTAAVDRHLNHRGYIVPGLGDAGDRCFGT